MHHEFLDSCLNVFKASPITDYKDFSIDTSVKILVSLSEEVQHRAASVDIHRALNLTTGTSTSSNALQDRFGQLQEYSVKDIFNELLDLRLTQFKSFPLSSNSLVVFFHIAIAIFLDCSTFKAEILATFTCHFVTAFNLFNPK